MHFLNNKAEMSSLVNVDNKDMTGETLTDIAVFLSLSILDKYKISFYHSAMW